MTIGERLFEERNKLGMNQPDFAALGGKTKKTLIEWEKGEAYPNAAFLAAISAHGADIQYIVTGQRSAHALSQDEQELLGYWRAAPLAVKAAAIGALQGGSAVPNIKQIAHGSVGQQVSGDVVNQKGVTIDVGTKAGGRRKR